MNYRWNSAARHGSPTAASRKRERHDSILLPEDFHVVDRLTDGLLQNDRCQMLSNTHSVAGPIPNDGYPYFDWVEDGGALVCLFKHQPRVFYADAGKRDAEKYLAEAKEFLAEAGVEVPEDFPFWKVIGVLFG